MKVRNLIGRDPCEDLNSIKKDSVMQHIFDAEKKSNNGVSYRSQKHLQKCRIYFITKNGVLLKPTMLRHYFEKFVGNMKQRRTRTKIITKPRGISMAQTRCNRRN